MKTSEILFRAREIQLQRGRAMLVRENARGAVCMLGALSLAISDEKCSGLDIPARCKLAIEQVLDVGFLWNFSDCECETVDDMAAAFEIAACCAAAKGK